MTEKTGRIEEPPLSLGLKFSFGVGSASESIFYIAFNLFCFFYFVQVLGLPGGLAGIAAAIALLFDAISDPMVGYLSDRWKPGRLGRRHPFMLASALPLGLAWMALFAPPEGLGTWGLFFWLLCFSVLARICQTVFYVPHIAMGGELTSDYTGRSRVFSWHIIFLWVGGAAVHFFGLRYFFATEEGGVNGMLIAENYPVYGVVWAFVMMAVILFSTLFTLSSIPRLRVDESAATPVELPPGSPGETRLFARYMWQVWEEMREVIGNRNYRIIVLALFIQAIGAGVYETVISHVINYIWQLTTQQFSLLAFSSMVGYALGFLLVVPLHKRFDKRMVIALSTCLMGVSHAVPVGMIWLGFDFEPGSNSALWLILVFSAIHYLGQSLMLASLVSIVGDIADEHELNTGRRREGTLYASRTLFSKMSASLGHLVAGIMLTVIAFPLGKDILPGTVPQANLDLLIEAYLLLVPLPYLVATWVYLRYDLTAGKHKKILETLQERRDQRRALAADS